MLVRLLMVVIALLALDVPRADACCLGCPCTKYQPRTETIPQPVYGYTRSVRGALPKWSIERITKLLVGGTWTPNTTPPRGAAALSVMQYDDRDGVPITYDIIPAKPIRFVPADQAATHKASAKERVVLIRRIEKHGSAILVEVDAEVWKLAACPKKAGFVCLVPAGSLQLAPVPPPGTP